ncbi:NAD(P)-dependent oxidoreductase [Kluyvera sp. NPDC087067]|uniref:NAD(P)-dependent oxidoreductase n=1 Tax=Kluyvera sp. NPDC087067 TaxID=3364105 RepID=UPI0037F125BD
MTHTDIQTVGFIGLGDQGLPMAQAIAQAGFVLHVWARRPSSLEALGDTAYISQSSVEALARQCDVICLCVRSDNDIFELLGKGLLAQIRPGTVVINHGTGTPANALKLAQLCQSAGALTLDVPVSGGRIAAQARTLTVLVGGNEDTFIRCKPVLESFSRDTHYMGPTGAGQYAKLFNNALLVQNFASIARTLELAVLCGLNPRQTLEGLKSGSAFSNAMSYLNTMITPANVAHHVAVLGEDMALFADAMGATGQPWQAVYEQGIAGIRALPQLIAALNAEEEKHE